MEASKDVNSYFDGYLLGRFITSYLTMIRDPIHGPIPLSEPEIELIDTPPMQRLRYVRQLSFVYLVYPGATHSRFDHSLGTFYLARRMGEILRQRQSWISLGEDDVRCLAASALLHDVGHPAFSHILEELPMVGGHERKAGEVVLSSDIASILEDKWKIDPNRVAAIVAGRPKSVVDRLTRDILTSCIGADRLDYLLRDAYFCGVPYGHIDVDRILQTIEIHPEGKPELIVNDKGIVPAETVLFSRYVMYRSVYLHHTARASTAMIKRAVEEAAQEDPLLLDRVYTKTDEWILTELENTEGAASELSKAVRDRRLFKGVVTRTWEMLEKKGVARDLVSVGQHPDEVHEIETRLVRELSKRLSRNDISEWSILLDIPRLFSETPHLWVRDRDTGDVDLITDYLVSPIAAHIGKDGLAKSWKLRIFTADDERVKKSIEEIWRESYDEA